MRRFSTLSRLPQLLASSCRCAFRACGASSPSSGGGPPPAAVPPVLQQFDQKMRTVPQWRQLYPQLLGAIVAGKRDDVVDIAGRMMDADSNVTPAAPAAPAEAPPSSPSSPPPSAKLSLIVESVAFADLFFAEVESDEEADVELLDIFLAVFDAEFKQQKARIGNALLEAVRQERDAVVEERQLTLQQPPQPSDGAGKSKVLPNMAISVTPPIDAGNKMTAARLLARARVELHELPDVLGGRAAVLRSLCRRLVFAGAVSGTAEEEERVATLTHQLIERRQEAEQEGGAASSSGDRRQDESLFLACQCAVENDIVDGDESSRDANAAGKRLRFDIGTSEGFGPAIGLGEHEVAATDEVGRRVCRRLNSAEFFAEAPLIPFSFTMRCRVG